MAKAQESLCNADHVDYLAGMKRQALFPRDWVARKSRQVTFNDLPTYLTLGALHASLEE